MGYAYQAGMIGLVVLIEQGAPEHAHLHRLAPLFHRARRAEVAAAPAVVGQRPINYYELCGALAEPPRRLVDCYRFLAVPRTAPMAMIVEAYLWIRHQGGGGRHGHV